MNTQINGLTQIRDETVSAAQVNSTIIIAAGTNPFTGDQSFGGNKLTNVATATLGTDAPNLNQVMAIATGLDWKNSVRVATTVAGTLASDFENGDTVDGVVLATGNRILIKNQVAPADNGIYTINATGAPTRSTDADTDAEVTAGLAVFVSEGTTNANTQWSLTTDDPIILGTTGLTFAQVGGGSSYVGSSSIDITGNVISVIFGSTSGTACQGNDARLSDARTPVGTALTSALIFVGSAANIVAAVAMSGDATISNTGVVTVTNQVRLSKFVVRETPSGAVNGANVTFTLAATPVAGSESIFLNGLLQDVGGANDYTISGATITFVTAPVTGDKIRVNYVSA